MDVQMLSATPLFHGIREGEIRQMLSCLGTHEKAYKKNELILRAGDPVHEIGMVESGSVNIVVNFYWGSSNILAISNRAGSLRRITLPFQAKSYSVMSSLLSRAGFFSST